MLEITVPVLLTVTVPLVTVNEPPAGVLPGEYVPAVGRTAQTGPGRTARGPTASIAINVLRSDSLRFGAFFMLISKRFVTRLRLTASS